MDHAHLACRLERPTFGTLAAWLARAGLAVAGVCLVGAAELRAADLPLRTPPVAPPPTFVTLSWTGFYAGVQAGYDWDHDHLTEVDTATGLPTGFVFNPHPDGFAGGGHVGADYQVDAVVVGAVADFEGTTDRGTFDGSPVGKGRDTVPWQGSVRGRIGYAFGNSLIYATGGFAYTNIQSTYVNLANMSTQAFSKLVTGWTVGGGVSYAFTDHWATTAEYRHSEYGRFGNATTIFAPLLLTGLADYSANAVRLGVSYRF